MLDSAASVTDIPGRVFTYAFSGDTPATTNGTYATHYYITNDGYRYSQRMRGLSPFRYVLNSNPRAFSISKAIPCTGTCAVPHMKPE